MNLPVDRNVLNGILGVDHLVFDVTYYLLEPFFFKRESWMMRFLRRRRKFLSLWRGETPLRGVEGHLVIMRLTESFPGLMVYLCDSTCTQSLFFSINERTIGRGEGRQYFSILRKWGRGEKIGQS